MEFFFEVIVAIHLLGMAAIVGAFFVQLRRKSAFSLTVMLVGAITQLVTGLAMVGLAEVIDEDLDYAKIGTKLVISVVVLVAVIVAGRVQKAGGRVQPWFHAAGGLAVVNVLIAVLWR